MTAFSNLCTAEPAVSVVTQHVLAGVMVFVSVVRHSRQPAEGNKNIVWKTIDVCRQQHLQ